MSRGSVASSLGHHKPFVKAKRSGDGGVGNVVQVDASLEERIGHVQFTKDFTFPTVTENLCDGG